VGDWNYPFWCMPDAPIDQVLLIHYAFLTLLCSECPECYQELQASVTTTRSDLQTTDSRILAVIEMMTTFNPFDSRFGEQRQVIQNQEHEIQALQQRHNMLVDHYEDNFVTNLSNISSTDSSDQLFS